MGACNLRMVSHHVDALPHPDQEPWHEVPALSRTPAVIGCSRRTAWVQAALSNASRKPSWLPNSLHLTQDEQAPCSAPGTLALATAMGAWQ